IGIVDHFHEVDNPANPRVARAIAEAADVFRAAGAVVKSAKLPSLQDFNAVAHILTTVEAFAVHQTEIRTRYMEFGELLRSRFSTGGLISGVDYVQAVRRRREICSAALAAMADVDILLSTASPCEARPLGINQKMRNL